MVEQHVLTKFVFQALDMVFAKTKHNTQHFKKSLPREFSNVEMEEKGRGGSIW